MPEAIQRQLGNITVVNLLVVCAALLVIARVAMARPLAEAPGRAQNAAELALDWFVDQARRIDPRAVRSIAPFLATLFLVVGWFGKVVIAAVVFLVDPSWFHGAAEVRWPEPTFRNFVAVALLAVLASRPHAHAHRGTRRDRG
jgi:F0F1-type ATP synthase membrane subunit a